jgi:catechol 2,3-dioxygenase-like lactoylglutathione lyase family enzyme
MRIASGYGRPMHFEGVHHVSVNVADHDAARRFYVETLGLVPLERPDFGFAGSWLAFPDGRQVHLIEVADHVAPEGQHFAIAVADIDAAVADLRGKGVEISDPHELPGGFGGRQAFFRDPSGNLLELNQPR